MNGPNRRSRITLFLKAVVILCGPLALAGPPLFAQSLDPAGQQSPPQSTPPAAAQPLQSQPQAERLSAPQLDALAAAIALYPDPLLSQVLVAATYPLELVEAQQWVQQNPQLTGADLVNAAQQQNWDPSVQALVAFPDVLARLSGNIKWTTALGNAFLAQQQDLMSSVQRLRQQAVASGKLTATPEETLNTRTQGNQTIIEIQPANPQVIYVPSYDPVAFWGPSIWAPYPWLGAGFSWGPSFLSFGFGIPVNSFFFGCCGFGWGGWGWSPFWSNRTVFVNHAFFQRFGFRPFFGRPGFAHTGRSVWAHDPLHRLAVPYPNRQLSTHFFNSSRASFAARQRAGSAAGVIPRSGVGWARGAPGTGGHGAWGAGNVTGARTWPAGGVRAPGFASNGARTGAAPAVRTIPTGGPAGTMRSGGAPVTGAPVTSMRPGVPAGGMRMTAPGSVRMGAPATGLGSGVPAGSMRPSAPMGGVRMGGAPMGGARVGGTPMGGVRMGAPAGGSFGGGARTGGGSSGGGRSGGFSGGGRGGGARR